MATDEVLAARDLLQNQARELARVSTQCQAVQASEKRNRLTKMELELLPEDATAYKAVGRMFVRSALPQVKQEIDATLKTCENEFVRLQGSMQHLQNAYEQQKKVFDTLLRQAHAQTTASS